MVSRKRRKSFIKELELEDGSFVRDNGNNANEISRFYRELFLEEWSTRPCTEGLEWNPISLNTAIWLERPFEEEKIHRAVFNLV